MVNIPLSKLRGISGSNRSATFRPVQKWLCKKSSEKKNMRIFGHFKSKHEKETTLGIWMDSDHKNLDS